MNKFQIFRFLCVGYLCCNYDQQILLLSSKLSMNKINKVFCELKIPPSSVSGRLNMCSSCYGKLKKERSSSRGWAWKWSGRREFYESRMRTSSFLLLLSSSSFKGCCALLPRHETPTEVMKMKDLSECWMNIKTQRSLHLSRPPLIFLISSIKITNKWRIKMNLRRVADRVERDVEMNYSFFLPFIMLFSLSSHDTFTASRSSSAVFCAGYTFHHHKWDEMKVGCFFSPTFVGRWWDRDRWKWQGEKTFSIYE